MFAEDFENNTSLSNHSYESGILDPPVHISSTFDPSRTAGFGFIVRTGLWWSEKHLR